MQALPQKTTDYIAEQFRAYYARKSRRGMTYKEAREIIDYLSITGPSPSPAGVSAIDTSKPNVTGSGGRIRPSLQRIEQILNVDENAANWDAVFDVLIEQYKERNHKKALKFIKLTFDLRLKREDACEKMHIAERTFNNYRIAILTAAAICAVSKGCNIDT